MGFEPVKNYHIREGCAYTEDNVLVYNVFVYKIPNTVTHQEARDYFSLFGGLNRVRLFSQFKSQKHAPKIAFINFVNAIDAAKVLQRRHYFHTKRIHVKACDSWNQPDVLKTIQKTSQNDIAGETQMPDSPMFKLNFDCLEHILKHLDTHDQICFARSCDKFYEAFYIYAKIKYKVVDFNKLGSLSLWDIRTLFKIAGNHIEALCGILPHRHRHRILEFAGNFIPNLRKLSIEGSKLRANLLNKFIDKMNVLSDVRFHDCEINENTVFALRKLATLEKLSLADNYEVTGKNLHLLTNVKELNLSDCFNVQNHFFLDMCKCLKNLTLLDIRHCERLHSNAYNEIANQLSNLETLRISCTDAQYEVIADLPKLKNLLLLQKSPIRNKLFDELAKKRSNSLVHLHIMSKNCIKIDNARMIAQLKNLKELICTNNLGLNDDCLREFANLKNLEVLVVKDCIEITNNGLHYLLCNCSKLKHLNIQRCINVTNEIVFDIIRKRQKCADILTIYANQSGINELILYNDTYIANSTVLKVKFERLDCKNTFETLEFIIDTDDDQSDLSFDLADHDDDIGEDFNEFFAQFHQGDDDDDEEGVFIF